ncbi:MULTISPECIES: hypothetical protein [Aneurinibacillus]|uniref:hypothetical protein n=1 Tax=Aneurinibacillus TaxID=55079 RepID=UPI000A600863|nr:MULTISPECIES: hypothetical protein [Aneurinibacillus]MED0677708.1 hypothetical protein [Aneurinibacillus thermoaerophilus]MED0738647.1 hypothetical protein [Aneurinibacillus thermoaerophilus]MED0759153.1 hypothetical protein [Aneurinibacillus thermoaerophilus]MED0762676.1 hypothetical protein [Aneurinibacillus thermoaerophilus]
MKLIHISKVDEKGGILLPDELAKSIHSGLLNVRVEEGKLLAKEPAPDYTLTWIPEKK